MAPRARKTQTDTQGGVEPLSRVLIGLTARMTSDSANEGIR